MKNLLLLAMIVSSFGCQTTSPSTQELELNNDMVGSKDPEEKPAINPTSNPGEITFVLEFLETFSTAKEICGIPKENVLKIRVVAIVEKGMGISNSPKTKDEILVNFIVLPNHLEPTAQLEVRAKESLCLDASKSYFTVISHKFLE